MNKLLLFLTLLISYNLQATKQDHYYFQDLNVKKIDSIKGSCINEIIFEGSTLITPPSAGKKVTFWDIFPLKERRKIKVGQIESFASNSFGTFATTSFRDKTITLRNRHGSFIRQLKGHTQEVMFTNFSPNGDTLASVSRDLTVRLWDLSSGLSRTIYNLGFLRALTITPDEKALISVSHDNIITFTDISNWKDFTLTVFQEYYGMSKNETPNWTNKIETIKEYKGDIGVCHATFSPDKKRLAVGSNYGDIEVWDFSNFKREKIFPKKLSGHTDRITSFAFNSDGTMLISASYDGTIIFWDLSDLSKEEIPSLKIKASKWAVYSVALSDDDKLLATIVLDDKVILWKLFEDEKEESNEGIDTIKQLMEECSLN